MEIIFGINSPVLDSAVFFVAVLMASPLSVCNENSDYINVYIDYKYARKMRVLFLTFAL